MIRIIVTSILFLLLAGCTVKVGKGDPEIKDAEKEKIEQQCDAIMQAFRDDSVDEAMAMLKKNSVISEEMVDTLHAQIVNQRPMFLSYGKPISFDFVQERKIKDYVSRRYYVIRYEKTYLPFAFTVFKTAYGWKITHFRYSSDLAEYIFQ